MGGSLAAKCRRQFPRAKIVGISRSKAALNSAKKKKWIHQGFQSVRDGVKAADMIILCTPINTFPKLLLEIDKHARPKTLVSDVGSVKGSVEKKVARQKWRNISFVSAHPMMGSHERGIKAANVNLYDEGYIFIIKSKKTTPANIKQATSFWKKIHPRVLVMTAKDHDTITGAISHLPHILAVCLTLFAEKKNLRFASSGFKSMTRMAQGDLSIWLPILLSNKKAVMTAIKGFERHLRQFRTAYNHSKPAQVEALLRRASRARKQI